MSRCVFIAADTPLPEVTPSQDDPLHIDLDTGTIFDGGADDNDCLLPFDEVDLYSEKKYGVYLELPQYQWTGRANYCLYQNSSEEGDSVCRKAEDDDRFCHPKKTYGYEFEV